MELSKYERATLFRKYIDHIDKLLVFLNNVQEHDLVLRMEETGFVSRPEFFICEKTDTSVLISAFEREKQELEEAFAAL